MKLQDLTQDSLNQVHDAYHHIAFPGVDRTRHPDCPHEDIRKVQEAVEKGWLRIFEDGWRFGILGWPHTKLRMHVEADGTLKFSISPNADLTGPRKLNTKQKPIIKKLQSWAETL